MRIRDLLLVCVPCAAILALCALAGPISVAVADEPPAYVATPTVSVELPPESRALPAETLDAEVLRALEYWNPRVLEETLRPWAQAFAEAGGNRADAIWLASQASVESKFIPEVLSYRCNQPGWKMCDHSKAVGPLQMHDKRMLGAAPIVQARRAIEWMRRRPQAWTTWKIARAQADQWLSGANTPRDPR